MIASRYRLSGDGEPVVITRPKRADESELMRPRGSKMSLATRWFVSGRDGSQASGLCIALGVGNGICLETPSHRCQDLLFRGRASAMSGTNRGRRALRSAQPVHLRFRLRILGRGHLEEQPEHTEGLHEISDLRDCQLMGINIGGFESVVQNRFSPGFVPCCRG